MVKKSKKMQNRRFLNHLGETNIWTVIIYVMFIGSLILSAYLFWWHNRTYVSYLVERVESDEERSTETRSYDDRNEEV